MIPLILLLAVGALLWAGSSSGSQTGAAPGGGLGPVGGPGTTTPFITDRAGQTWFPLSPEIVQATHPTVASPLAPLLRTRLHVGQTVAVAFTSNGGITAIALAGVIRNSQPDVVTLDIYYDVEFQASDVSLLGATPVPTFAFPIRFNVKAIDVYDTVPPTVHSGAPLSFSGESIPFPPISYVGRASLALVLKYESPGGCDTVPWPTIWKDGAGNYFYSSGFGYTPLGSGPESNYLLTKADIDACA